jgi:WD40-like Beta Propeller Repeat
LRFGHIFLVPIRPVKSTPWARAAALGVLLFLSQCSLLSVDSLDDGVAAQDEWSRDSGGGSSEDDTAPPPFDGASQSPGDSASPIGADSASVTPAIDAKAPTSDAGGGDTNVADAAVDAGGNCDGTKPFGAPALLTSLLSASREAGLHLLPDELSGFFWQGPLGATALLRTSRADRASAFGSVAELKNVNAGTAQYDPSASGDGLSLVFRTNATGASNGDDLYWSSRTNVANDFSKGTPIASVNTSFSEVQPFLVPDGSSLYFSSNAAGNYDIYRTQGAGNGAFASPTPVSEVNESAYADQNPTVTADDLTMVFSSTRSGGQSGQDVWLTTRRSRASSFASPVNLSEVNSGGNDYPSWLSSDGCRLYLYSDRSGTLHIYEAARPR